MSSARLRHNDGLGPDNHTGRYRLQERLPGEGDAWLAEDLEDPTSAVVLKLLPPGRGAFDAQAVVDRAASIPHIGIAVPVDAGETPDGRGFIVLPYLQGHTLRDVLNASGPLPFTRIAGWTRQLGEALERAHEGGLIHGAIAPEHIIVSGDRVALISASWFGEPTVPPGYLAPEPERGKSADIYSLGTVIVEMLTGRRAFRYGSLSDLQRQQRIGLALGSVRKLRARVPARAEEELRKALAYHPAHRPAEARVMCNRIAESLAEAGRAPWTRPILFVVLLLVVFVISLMRACSH